MKRTLLLIAIAACAGGEKQATVVVNAPAAPSCPEGTVYNGVACAELLATKEPDAGTLVSQIAPSGPAVLLDEARDMRPFSRRPRANALLVVEVQALERLQAATAQSAPDYPQIAQRIAEDWFELAYARAQAGDAHGASEARRKAIAEYLILTSGFPSFARLDEVIYFLGLAYEIEGEATYARKTYFQLISQHPSSPKIPYAYYAFGEMFFHEAKSDPSKWMLAVQSYQEALKFPDPNLQPWAMLRIGQAHTQRGDAMAAKAMFARLKSQYPQSAAASQAP